ncbi:60KD_IMP domain-containing protein/TPR_2 domain-containing protein/TPR_16 domain-containing protein, partial [Cephalotus follicularis]
MAISKLLFSHLHRSRSLSTHYLARTLHFLSNSTSNPQPSTRVSSLGADAATLTFHFSHSRSFSTPSIDDSEFNSLTDSVVTDSTVTESGFNELLNSTAVVDDSILPVRAVISLLDGYHDLTALPWWLIIASSTLAMRLTLLPVVILQLQKLQRIAELLPKLPPPLPPFLSGKSYKDQLSLFRRERRAIGCPSYLWFVASFSIQIPCFLLWVTSIRKMALNHHPGFDSGGALWFQNLTELPHGVLSPIFPLLIAGLHYVNVQISFKTSLVENAKDVFHLLAKYYKLYLDLLTLPLFFVGFCIPQGSHVYWVTNSLLSLIQQLFLKHPAVRAKLGLPDKNTQTTAENFKKVDAPVLTPSDIPEDWQKISVENLSPDILVRVGTLLSNGHKEGAISLLRLALDKDPDYVGALMVLGKTLFHEGQLAEATGYFERAISKLLLAGHPTEVGDVYNLIRTSGWAGLACIQQGKKAEGLVHLERLANLKEPEDPVSKADYFYGLSILARVLYDEGRKAEAATYLRLAVAYNPDYKELLVQCENNENSLVDDLASSRRTDY